MYQTLRKLGYFKFTDEFKKSGINNVGYLRYLILRKSSKSGLRLLSDEDCFYEVMKHWRVYGLVHIYAELVPLLVNDLDGSNDFPNREKGQFGQNGGVGLNEGVGETFGEGFEYAEDCEVSSATEGMDASVLRNVWNYLMLVHDEEILVNVRHLPLHLVLQSSVCSRVIHQMMMQMLVKRVNCQDMRLTTQHHLTQATMIVLTVKKKIQVSKGVGGQLHMILIIQNGLSVWFLTMLNNSEMLRENLLLKKDMI